MCWWSTNWSAVVASGAGQRRTTPFQQIYGHVRGLGGRNRPAQSNSTAKSVLEPFSRRARRPQVHVERGGCITVRLEPLENRNSPRIPTKACPASHRCSLLGSGVIRGLKPPRPCIFPHVDFISCAWTALLGNQSITVRTVGVRGGVEQLHQSCITSLRHPRNVPAIAQQPVRSLDQSRASICCSHTPPAQQSFDVQTV